MRAAYIQNSANGSPAQYLKKHIYTNFINDELLLYITIRNANLIDCENNGGAWGPGGETNETYKI